MAQVSERKRTPATRTRSRVSVADRELEAMKAVLLDITSSKDKGEAFLKESGYLDKQGRVTKPYRD